MMHRLLSLYRRLLGRKSDEPTSAGADERRVWVRYPSVARTTVKPMANGDDGRLSARVRNVSRGGANLVVTHAFKAGDMISLEVPTDTPERVETALACVVHVTPLPDGFWSLGCAFSEMLDERELEAFISRQESPSRAEKRGRARLPCRTRASYQVVSDPHKRTWTAGVLDISLGGIGLMTDQVVETGALLNLNLESSEGTARTILACVVHVLATGSGRVLGCNFINELSESDLAALV